MNPLEKIDLVLRGLHENTRNGRMLELNPYLNGYGENMPPEEIKEIVSIINRHDYGIYQVGIKGYRLQITAAVLRFVETSSFSNPGTSILNL